MKKLYVLAGALFMATGAFAQGHELFFSAYNEGAHPNTTVPPGGGTASLGNEKAIQIFNPTTSSVDMSQYSIARFSNGSPVPTEEEKLIRNKPTTGNNQLASADVFVYGAVDATLLEIVNVWDQQAAAYTSTASSVITKGGAAAWNGNDAVALIRWIGGTPGKLNPTASDPQLPGAGTPVIVDIFGVIGEDPAGGAWFSNTTVGGQNVLLASSKNMSLNRKSNIEHGTTVNPTSGSFLISDEWEKFSEWNGGTTPADYYSQDYSNLASHTYTGQLGTYSVTGVLEDFNRAINVYPNPVTNKELSISIKNTKVSEITILNAVGQNIKVVPANAASAEIKVNVSSLKQGMYFVKFVGDNEYKTTIYKTVVVQ
ncbi:T9SS type A sorting domain-containing protein [Adhaeribacter terreus]|uniref:T9SS type A sorting domain-containing protein n=1 Tax=Adhaeribacter terreus TaxID=529703 RepID=A0ABW0EE90_9BACT